MGELHIEIIHDRIRREYGIETHLGPLQVAYRETILHQVSTTGTLIQIKSVLFSDTLTGYKHGLSFLLCAVETLDRTVGDRRHIVTVELTVRPADSSSCDSAFTEELQTQLSAEIKEAVHNGVHSSYLQGKTDITYGITLKNPLTF